MLEHQRSYNFKIFFNNGEGKSIPNKPLQSILEVIISKFSSTLVKLSHSEQAIIEHSRADKFKIFFNHGEGKPLRTSHCEGKCIANKPPQSILEVMVMISKCSSTMIKVNHSEQTISEYSKAYNFRIFFNHGEGELSRTSCFKSIPEVMVSKFSSTMVKVNVQQISHFRAFQIQRLCFQNIFQP